MSYGGMLQISLTLDRYPFAPPVAWISLIGTGGPIHGSLSPAMARPPTLGWTADRSKRRLGSRRATCPLGPYVLAWTQARPFPGARHSPNPILSCMPRGTQSLTWLTRAVRSRTADAQMDLKQGPMAASGHGQHPVHQVRTCSH